MPTEVNPQSPRRLIECIVREIGERLRAEEERRKLQEELLHAQKMESIGHWRGVAHDFNDLLLVILANAHLLRRRRQEHSQEMDEIVAASERASALTRQLLSFSRRRVLKPAVLDINEVLRGLAHVLERLVGENMKLEVALSSCRAGYSRMPDRSSKWY